MSRRFRDLKTLIERAVLFVTWVVIIVFLWLVKRLSP